MLKRIWIWLCRERTRQTLAFLGGGLVVVVSGLWTYFHGSTNEKHPVPMVALQPVAQEPSTTVRQDARAEPGGIAINASGQASVTVSESKR